MNTVQLWLVPLLLGSAFGITACLRVSLRWSYAYLLQHLVIGGIALAGLLTAGTRAWLWALGGWALFLIFNIGRRTLIGSIGNNLAALRTSAALRQIKVLKLLSWGPPGRCWYDLVSMLQCYAKEDIAGAEAVAARWKDFPLPPPMRDMFTAYALTGTLMNRNWPAVLVKYSEAVDQYNKDMATKVKGASYPAQAAISACRAYCELGKFDQAVDCLEAADLAANFYQKEALETIYLSFYALAGARCELEALLTEMPPRAGVPEYGRVYWQARCAAACRDFTEACKLFDRCISLLPANDEAWRQRVVYQKSRVPATARAALASGADGSGDDTADNNAALKALLAEHDSLNDFQPGTTEIMNACDERTSEQGAGFGQGEHAGEKNLLQAGVIDSVHIARSTGNCEPFTSSTIACASASQVARAAALQDRAAVVGSIMDSGRRGPAVKSVVMVLSCIFFPGMAAQLLNNQWLGGIYFSLFSQGYLRGDLVMSGQYWRVFSYLLLHANLSHLFMNLFGLVWLGRHVENVYGSGRFLIIFAGAGVASGILQMVLTPQEAAVGASGAVMGIFGASAAATLRLKDVLPAKVRKAELKWMTGLAVMQLGFDQFVNLVSSFHDKGEAVRIASWAHAGGMLAGFLLGYCLPLRSFAKSPEKSISATGSAAN